MVLSASLQWGASAWVWGETQTGWQQPADRAWYWFQGAAGQLWGLQGQWFQERDLNVAIRDPHLQKKRCRIKILPTPETGNYNWPNMNLSISLGYTRDLRTLHHFLLFKTNTKVPLEGLREAKQTKPQEVSDCQKLPYALSLFLVGLFLFYLTGSNPVQQPKHFCSSVT